MFKKRLLSTAILSTATGISLSVIAEDGGLRIEELVVTATKRSESMQDIPLAMQALGEENLDNFNVNNFSDYLKQLPNVSFAGRGPGQNDVYIRGIATNKGSLFQAGGIGAGPTVAFYIDEAPITAAGRNLDVYVTDMERIEVLPGPQGTLYGASSQAGTVRMISNKPDLNDIAFGFEGSLSTMPEGEESFGAEGFVNIPIVADRLAVRIAAYDVRFGGYIDNVPGTTSFAESTVATFNANSELRVADNADFVEDDFNESRYTGARVTAAIALTDDWNLTLGYMTQELEADGVFDYSPDVGDLEVQRFSEDKLEDEFDQVNLTLEGRLAGLDIIYAGSYLEREVEQSIDYVGYTIGGAFQVFYNCTYSAGYGSPVDVCAAPSQRYLGFQESENTQHELRFNTDPTASLRLVAGIYYDKSEGGVSQNWKYHSPELDGLDFAPNAPHSQANDFFDPNVRDPDIAFFNDIVPDSDQLAFFGELTYDINELLSATVGLRRYEIDFDVNGSFNFASGGGFEGAIDGDGGGTLNDVGPETEKDTIAKFTLNITPDDDLLFYFTYSEGFRRGGFNRQGDVINITTGEFEFPAFFGSDTIDNYEFGWKTTLFDERLRFNGAAYFIDWSNVQIDIFDQSVNRLLFTANAGEAEVTGIEGDLTFLLNEQWMLSRAFSINDTELTDRPEGADNLLPAGSDLALTPSFQGNVALNYQFTLAGYESYVQLAAQHRGSTNTSVVINENFELDSYTTADLSFGMDMENWGLKVFVTNLTDKRTELFISNQDDIPRTVTSRPREFTVKVSYDY